MNWGLPFEAEGHWPVHTQDAGKFSPKGEMLCEDPCNKLVADQMDWREMAGIE